MNELKVHRVNFFDQKPEAIQSLVYDESSLQLAVARSDSSIEIWDLSHKPFLLKVIAGKGSGSVEAVAWAEGRLFSAGLHGYIIEHDLVTLTEKRTVAVSSNGGVWCLGVDKQNKYIATGTEDGRICLYSIANDQLNFENTFSKQEGRILCLDWHEAGDIIVSGCIDAIRIWDVKTGRIIDRMVVGRSSVNVETIIWCIAVTRDMTIISGDSRGKTSFWNGKMATLIESILTHKGDVLSLCVNKEGNIVYSSGVDPTVVKYVRSKIQSHAGGKTKEVWIKSVHKWTHTHDVRALVYTDEFLISGGVDTKLLFSKYPPEKVKTFAPFSQRSYLSIANEPSLMLLKYSTQLELWRLGTTQATGGNDEDQLPLDTPPLKILLLKAKVDEPIICSILSRKGNWIAYSSLIQLRLFFLHKNAASESLTVQKIKFLPNEINPAICLTSTSSGGLVAVTALGRIQIIDIDCSSQDSVKVNATIKSDMKHIYLLDVSEDNLFLAVGAACGIEVYNLLTNQLHCRLPNYKCKATALKFDLDSRNLVAAYCDRKVVEYDLKELCYSRWYRKQNFEKFKNFGSDHVVKGITFLPSNKKVIILHDDRYVYLFDKTADQETEEKRAKDFDGTVKRSSYQRNFKFIQRYCNLLNLCHLRDNEMVVLELKSEDVMSVLPPPLRQKKYGT